MWKGFLEWYLRWIGKGEKGLFLRFFDFRGRVFFLIYRFFVLIVEFGLRNWAVIVWLRFFSLFFGG